MRPANEHARVTPSTHPDWSSSLWSTEAFGNNGAFVMPSCEPGWSLFMIVSDGPLESGGTAWEHVSVHARRGDRQRTPTWKEMCQVKDTWWEPEDVVIQFHPAASEYVNRHHHCLHLWRPVGVSVLTPPKEMVG